MELPIFFLSLSLSKNKTHSHEGFRLYIYFTIEIRFFRFFETILLFSYINITQYEIHSSHNSVDFCCCCHFCLLIFVFSCTTETNNTTRIIQYRTFIFIYLMLILRIIKSEKKKVLRKVLNLILN